MKSTIDTARLARNGETIRGDLSVARLPRLASLLATTDGQLDWCARGWREQRPEGGHDDFLELSFSATVHPACVRCLEPVAVAACDRRRYRLVDTEAEAERLDPQDDEYDVLAGGPRFDLEALIEDEAIFALPPMPRHDDCVAVAGDEAATAERGPEKPFAALQRLRRGPPAADDETTS
ncbi:MAG: DUF177 domain-containing protein [Burkholderiaceae bacterium]|nr:DUF177 domain-containing protein [Burkholderiaceae bacterium]